MALTSSIKFKNQWSIWHRALRCYCKPIINDTQKDYNQFREQEYDGNFNKQFSKSKKHLKNKIKNPNDGNLLRSKSHIYKNRIFGIHPVLLALQANKRRPYHLYYKQSQGDKLEEILKIAENKGILVTEADNYKMQELLGPERVHQGVCLVASPLMSPIYENTDDKFQNWITKNITINFNKKNLWVYLDGIMDPGNLGSILRTVYFFGIDFIMTGKDGSCPITSTVSKISSGVAEIMPCVVIKDPVNALKSLKGDGWNIVGTALNKKENVIDVDDYQFTQNSIIVLGNEGKGISPEIQELCNVNVTITGRPNNHVQSLNVSAATSVLLSRLVQKINT